MKYIIADMDKAEGSTVCDLSTRYQKDGRVILNENDLKKLSGDFDSKVEAINGEVISEEAALQLIQNWK